HEHVLEMVKSHKAAGLRIDHVDGLWDPQRYLQRLQRHIQASENRGEKSPFYVVVEKILARDEPLPQDWPVEGTTGYDFLNVVGDLFIDPEQLGRLDWIYQRATGLTDTYDEIVYQAKRQVLDESFTAYVRSLSFTLEEISDQDRHGRD